MDSHYPFGIFKLFFILPHGVKHVLVFLILKNLKLNFLKTPKNVDIHVLVGNV